MNAPTETLPAIHDWHLKQVLEDLRLLSDFEQGRARCIKCDRLISLDSLGGILVGKARSYKLVCDHPDCLDTVTRDTAR